MAAEFEHSIGQVTPTEIGPKPTIVKTPLMEAVEARFALPGEQIDRLLIRLYEENGTIASVRRLINGSSEIALNQTTLGAWMKTLNPDFKIKTRKEARAEPDVEEYRLSRITEFWNDPKKKEAAVARIQTPQAKAKRSKIRKEQIKAGLFKTPPTGIIPPNFEVYLRQLEVKRYALLGEDYSVLAEMTTHGFTDEEIASKLNRSRGVIYQWLRKAKIESVRPRRGIDRETYEMRQQLVEKAINENRFENLTPIEQKAALALYPAGQTRIPVPSDIARELVVSREYIRQLDERILAKLEESETHGKVSKKVRGKSKRIMLSYSVVRELYVMEKLTLEELGALFKVSTSTILNILTKMDVDRSPGRRRIEIPRYKLKELLQQGKTLQESAWIFKCSPGTIYNRIKEEGLKTDLKKGRPKKSD